VAAVSAPRVGEEGIGHGMAEDGLEESEGIGETAVVVPAKVEWVFREGYVGLPAGVVGATTVTRPPRPWGWRWPDPCGVVGLSKGRGKPVMRGRCD
jgi:hypothetical protein